MYRNAPQRVFRSLFQKLNLSFSREMLEWQPKTRVTFDGMGGAQENFYQRVLQSRKLEPAKEPLPEIERFPTSFQAHVKECLSLYQELLKNKNLIAPKDLITDTRLAN